MTESGEIALAHIETLDRMGYLVRARIRATRVLGFIDGPSYQAFEEWHSRALTFLARLLKPDHIYAARFKENVRDATVLDIRIGQEVLRAIRDDIEQGELRGAQPLDMAEVYADSWWMPAQPDTPAIPPPPPPDLIPVPDPAPPPTRLTDAEPTPGPEEPPSGPNQHSRDLPPIVSVWTAAAGTEHEGSDKDSKQADMDDGSNPLAPDEGDRWAHLGLYDRILRYSRPPAHLPSSARLQKALKQQQKAAQIDAPNSAARRQQRVEPAPVLALTPRKERRLLSRRLFIPPPAPRKGAKGRKAES